MKRYLIIFTLLFVCLNVYSQQMPLLKIAPQKSSFFKESTGKAIVNNESLTYWLYQTSADDMWELIRYLHSYVESIGFVIDFDSFSGVEDNPHLARSVRSLMFWQNRNISITIWNNTLIINIDTDQDGSIDNREYFFMSWQLKNIH